MAKELSGIFAPVSTPFIREEISLGQLRDNMQKYRETDLAGYFSLGSNGENKSLTEEEKLKLLEVVVVEKAPHQIVMAGSGYESTRQTIAFSKQAADCGADFVSVLAPSYFQKRMTDEALIRFFTDVADAVPVPVVIYNAPGFTGITLSAGVIGQLSTHPNIAGMKDTSKGNMSGYAAAAGPAFDLLSGSVSAIMTDMLLGGKGGVASLANAFPAPCCELYARCKAGDVEGARTLHNMLFKLNRSVSGSFGVAGVKYAMELGGFHGGDPRLPLLPMTPEGRRLVRDAVAAAGLI